MNNIIAAGCLGVVVLWFCIVVARAAARKPECVWAVALLAVFATGTRFRGRGADASLRGEIDGQIIFELGMYFAAAIIIVALILALRDRLRAHIPSASQWLCVAFCACAIFSSTWSINPLYTLTRSLQATVLMGLAVVGLRLFGAAKVVTIVSKIAVVYALVMAGLKVAFLVARGNPSHLVQFRFKWAYNHPLEVASFFCIAGLFVLAAFLYRKKPGVPTAIAFLLVSTFFVLIVLTRSRAPLFTFLLVSGILVGSRFLRVRISGFVFFGTLVLTLCLPLFSVDSLVSGGHEFASGNNLLNTYVLRDQSEETLTTLTGRTKMWSEAVLILARRPFLGCGYQASRQELLELASWMGHAHNGFLAMALDLGVLIPLFLLLPFLSGTLKLLRRPTGQDENWWAAVLGAIGFFLFLQMATDTGLAGNPGATLFLAFVCANASSLGCREDEPGDHSTGFEDRRTSE